MSGLACDNHLLFRVKVFQGTPMPGCVGKESKGMYDPD
jgi:hypothetical protein